MSIIFLFKSQKNTKIKKKYKKNKNFFKKLAFVCYILYVLF